MHLPKLVRSLELVVGRRKTTHYPLRQSPKANIAFSGRGEASPLPTTNFKVKRGFTLIELLVVVTIISLLTGTATVAFRNAVTKGDDSKRKQDLTAVKDALSMYYLQERAYPPQTGAGVSAYVGASDEADWLTELVTKNYIKQLPKDPKQASSRLEFIKPVYALTEESKTALPTLQGYSYQFGASPYTGNNHFLNVDDPIGSPDEDATNLQVVCTEVDCIVVNVIDSWIFANPGIPAGTTGINKVRTWVRAKKGPSDAGIMVRSLLRINNNYYEIGSSAITQTYQWYSFESTTNPATGNPWQLAEITNLEAGVRANGNPIQHYVTAFYIEVFYPVAASPTPTPTATPIATPTPPGATPPPAVSGCTDVTKKNVYCYEVTADRQDYTLWAQLHNLKDPQIASCGTPPTNEFNYCLKPDI